MVASVGDVARLDASPVSGDDRRAQIAPAPSRRGKAVPSLMDFSHVELSEDDRQFQGELRAFLKTLVTQEVIERDRQTGENFDEGVHLALGTAGYLERDWKDEARRWFQPAPSAQSGTWRLRAHTRRGSTGGQLRWFAHTVAQFGFGRAQGRGVGARAVGSVPAVPWLYRAGGRLRRPRRARRGAVRDGDGWVINGSKMFTSKRAQTRSTSFLVTNTDPDAPKHQSLTMFSRSDGCTRGGDSAHPHRRRRPHQHHLLQRRAGRRQVPSG